MRPSSRRILPVALIVLAVLMPPLPVAADSATPASPGGPASPDGLVSRVFNLKYRGADDAYILVSPYLSPRGSIRSQPHQRTLTVVDTAAVVAQVETLIAGFDLPPRVVEVAVQLILASAEKAAQSPAPPPPIRGVIERLNALNTRWSDYRLVGDARVLGTEGERSTLQVGDDYRVDFKIDPIDEGSRLIRFKPFELARRDPTVETGDRYTPVLNTVLNLRDSQLFIVGASKMERSNRALFMTITASMPKP
jgi:type II/III secretion system protein